MVQLHRAGFRYIQKPVRHYPRTAGKSSVSIGDVPRTFFALAKLWVRLRLSSSASTKLAPHD